MMKIPTDWKIAGLIGGALIGLGMLVRAQDDKAAPATPDKSNPFAELVAWITLLDAWGYLAIITIVGGLFFIVWRMNSSRESPFSIADALEDSMTRKTSIMKIIVFGCFLGSWLSIFWMLASGKDIMAVLSLVLAIFVGKSASDRWAEVADPRVKAQAFNVAPGSQPPPPDPPTTAVGDVTTTLTVKP